MKLTMLLNGVYKLEIDIEHNRSFEVYFKQGNKLRHWKEEDWKKNKFYYSQIQNAVDEKCDEYDNDDRYFSYDLDRRTI